MADPANPAAKLRDLRDSIDNIDAAIVHMLAERFRCTRLVGKLKAQQGLPSRDPGREAEQVSEARFAEDSPLEGARFEPVVLQRDIAQTAVVENSGLSAEDRHPQTAHCLAICRTAGRGIAPRRSG